MMEYSNKAKIALVFGIGIIVFVASLLGLPFFDAHNNVQKATQSSIAKVEGSEAKMLDVIAQEKAELELKLDGRISP